MAELAYLCYSVMCSLCDLFRDPEALLVMTELANAQFFFIPCDVVILRRKHGEYSAELSQGPFCLTRSNPTHYKWNN